MNKKKKDTDEPLEDKVRSKIKGLGLDALFHLVDVNQKDQDVYETKDGKPFQHKKFLHQFQQSSLRWTRGKIFQMSGASIFSKQISTVLGIHISSSTIKIIQFKYIQDKIQLSFLKNVEIPHIVTSTPEKYEEFVLDTLSQIDRKIFRSSHVCALIPRHKAILKFVELPTTKTKEIHKMLHFEAEHLLPFPLEELEYDFAIIHKKENSTDILLAAIKKDDLEEAQRLIRQANIRLQAVDLTSLSVLNSLEDNAPSAGTHIQVRIGADSIDINILQNSRLKVSRGINWGSKHLTENIAQNLHVDFEIAEKSKKDFGIILRKTIDEDVAKAVSDEAKKWADALIEEINKTLQQYTMQTRTAKADHISLYGGGAQLAHLDEYIKDKTEIKISLPTPSKNIEIHPDIKAETYTFPEMTPLLGVSHRILKKPALSLNLLPRKIKQAQARQRITLQRSVIFGLFLLLSFSLIRFPSLLLTFQEHHLQNLDNKMTRLAPDVRAAERIKNRVETINNYFSFKRSCMEILRELSLLVSLDIIIETFSFDKDKSVTLVGEAESHRSVVKLSSLIRESSFFDDAVLKYSNKKDRTKDNVNFEIVCTLNKTK